MHASGIGRGRRRRLITAPSEPWTSRGPVTDFAEFLADREGLVGGSREHFRRLLGEYGGFRNRPSRPPSPLPIIAALILGLAGVMWQRPTRWTDRVAWIEFAVFSAYLIWRLRQEHRKLGKIDRETHWEAYRLFLRPILVCDHPGLLDRNLAPPRPAHRPLPDRPIPAFRRSMHEPGRDFWYSLLAGCWVATGVLVIFQHPFAGIRQWSMAFPAAGVLLGFLAWLGWRRLAYLIVRKDSRLLDA